MGILYAKRVLKFLSFLLSFLYKKKKLIFDNIPPISFYQPLI